VVVRVDRRAAAELVGPGGDDLVGVGVGRGAGAGLEDVERELGVPPPLGDLGGGRLDHTGSLRVEQAEPRVDLAGGPLDQADGPEGRPREPDPLIGKFSTARAVVAP
jgi:hypothetical protein